MKKKSAISLISYDANDYLTKSIEKYYDYVDEIVLGIDKDRVTWSKNKFNIDESTLWSELSNLDGDNKISIIEENFHESDVPIENDNFERNYLKSNCSHDWIFSFDADEVLLNAKQFFHDYCPIAERYYNKYDICMTWATPYKVVKDNEGNSITLVIANDDASPFFGENQGVVTSSDSTFMYARWTDKSQHGMNRIASPLVALHYSLCRSNENLKEKITNIGHSDLAEKDPFFQIWSKVDFENYKELKDFKTSGLGSAQWPSLEPVPTEYLEEYLTENLHRAY